MSRKKKLLLIITIFFFLVFSINFPYSILDYQDGMFVTTTELNNMLDSGHIVSSRIINVSASWKDLCFSFPL